MSDAPVASEAEALAAVARLLGRLLVGEIDPPLHAALREPSLAGALAALGLALPPGESAAVCEALGADYYAAILAPTQGVPLIQSLAQEGRYEGEAAVRVRQLAGEVGLELDSGKARGAPPDHLGALLLLWADLQSCWPEGAQCLARDHLSWSRGPLDELGRRPGFYGALGRATRLFVDVLSPR